VKSLYRMCAGHSLLPGSLHFELHDHPIDVAPCHGGFAVVSKREYRGKEVAVKVLQLRRDNDLQVLNDVRHLQISTCLLVLANRAQHL